MNKKEKIKIKILKAQIETDQICLDRYVKSIVRSNFIDCCTGGAYFNQLWLDLFKHGKERVEYSKLPKKKKTELLNNWFMNTMFGTKAKTELDKLESNLAYQKRLTGWAKSLLSNLNDTDKEKMIMDCIRQQELWSNQFNINTKLYKALETNKKPIKRKLVKKKPVRKKVKTSKKLKRAKTNSRSIKR